MSGHKNVSEVSGHVILHIFGQELYKEMVLYFQTIKKPTPSLILENNNKEIHSYWRVTEIAAKVRDSEKGAAKMMRTVSGYGHSGWIVVGLS